MDITASQSGGLLIIRLAGELDHHAARAAMREIDMRIDLGLPRECALDMSRLAFMDSSGVAVVLKTYKRMREIGGRLWLENVPQQAMRVIDASGVDRLVAVSALGQGGLHNERA